MEAEIHRPVTAGVDVDEVLARFPKQDVPHTAQAWEFWNKMGSPKFHVAPMVDQSELPFRMLCRRYGATCAYSPMIHARLFSSDPKHRSDSFSTCPEDRPLLVQFCANDPAHLLAAARLVEGQCDAVDLNLGCPQRIARRGYYGAFLMDDLQLVERLVATLAQNLSIPITVKMRIFPDLAQTLAYAQMLERAGAYLVAVHGRTRDMKDNTATRADWDAIRAVKAALTVPVLANGNIRSLADAHQCMAYTGCDGVLSAEGLLEDPAMFDPTRVAPEGDAYSPHLKAVALMREYLHLCTQFPVPLRMVKGHVHKLLAHWLQEHHDLRDRVNSEAAGLDGYLAIVEDLEQRIAASGRDHPVAQPTSRELARRDKEAARLAAMSAQDEEAAALAALDAQQESGGCGEGVCAECY